MTSRSFHAVRPRSRVPRERPKPVQVASSTAMLHPVGSLPPSVYWRRRAALLASLVVLIGLTAWVLHSSDKGTASGAGGPSTTPHTTPQTQTTQRTTTAGSNSSPPAASSSSSSASASTTGGVLRCTPVQLTV